LNPSNQEASRVQGLDDIVSIVSKCSVREALYHERYELDPVGEGQRDFESSHTAYHDTLKAVYAAILTFQATCAVYLFKNPWKKYARDFTKWDTWDDMLDEIRKRDSTLKSMDERWRDQRYEENWKKKVAQHLQKIKKLEAIEDEMARFRDLVSDNYKKFWDKNAQYEHWNLLEWLTTVQPSDYYNRGRDRARKKDGTSTAGDWLVKDKGHDFQSWLKQVNSLIWLYGKGKYLFHSIGIQLLMADKPPAGAGKSIITCADSFLFCTSCKSDTDLISSSVIHYLAEA
jgi:hypothetical protein